jgi:hypothetical protein
MARNGPARAWSRSPNLNNNNDNNNVCTVEADGDANNWNCNNSYAVAPAPMNARSSNAAPRGAKAEHIIKGGLFPVECLPLVAGGRQTHRTEADAHCVSAAAAAKAGRCWVLASTRDKHDIRRNLRL